jgi:hypothetical protein
MTVQLSTVNKYGHVLLSIDKRYYSVPYKLIGKRLKIKYTTTQLQVYDAHVELIVSDKTLLYKGIVYLIDWL